MANAAIHGAQKQTSAAWRHDINVPKTNTNITPKVYAIPASADNTPRIDGSLKLNRKLFWFSNDFNVFRLRYFTDVSHNWCLHESDTDAKQTERNQNHVEFLCVVHKKPRSAHRYIHHYHCPFSSNRFGDKTRKYTTNRLTYEWNTRWFKYVNFS